MIIEANNLLVTTAALDCHVHYICPQLVSVGMDKQGAKPWAADI